MIYINVDTLVGYFIINCGIYHYVLSFELTIISPSCIFFSTFDSTELLVCIVPSDVIAQLAVSRPRFLFRSHPGVPT